MANKVFIAMLYILTTSVCHAGDFEKTEIKGLTIDEGKAKMILILTGIKEDGSVEVLLQKLNDHPLLLLTENEIVYSKNKAMIYLSTRETKHVNILQVEKILIELGLENIEYNGQQINTADLSEIYSPVHREEFRTFTRPE